MFAVDTMPDGDTAQLLDHHAAAAGGCCGPGQFTGPEPWAGTALHTAGGVRAGAEEEQAGREKEKRNSRGGAESDHAEAFPDLQLRPRSEEGRRTSPEHMR